MGNEPTLSKLGLGLVLARFRLPQGLGIRCTRGLLITDLSGLLPCRIAEQRISSPWGTQNRVRTRPKPNLASAGPLPIRFEYHGNAPNGDRATR
jgi:hypothetical protein